MSPPARRWPHLFVVLGLSQPQPQPPTGVKIGYRSAIAASDSTTIKDVMLYYPGFCIFDALRANKRRISMVK